MGTKFEMVKEVLDTIGKGMRLLLLLAGIILIFAIVNFVKNVGQV